MSKVKSNKNNRQREFCYPQAGQSRIAPRRAPDGNPVVDRMPRTNHRVITTVLDHGTHRDAIRQRDATHRARRAPDGNPVVDRMPRTNHRVATTVLYHGAASNLIRIGIIQCFTLSEAMRWSNRPQPIIFLFELILKILLDPADNWW